MGGFEVIGLRLDLVVLPVVVGLLLVVGVVLMVLGATTFRDRYLDMWGGVGWAGTVFACFGGVLAVIWVLVLMPFQPLYHHWYSATGMVESATNVFDSGSGELSSGYVVELGAVDKPLLFDDPRILRSVGEEVTVTCSVEWVPAGADRLNCWLAN